jgi:hypothetical protein
MTDFRITTQHDSDGVVRLLVAGETDLATADEIAAATEKALADHRPARLIIDLAAVTSTPQASETCSPPSTSPRKAAPTYASSTPPVARCAC